MNLKKALGKLKGRKLTAIHHAAHRFLRTRNFVVIALIAVTFIIFLTKRRVAPNEIARTPLTKHLIAQTLSPFLDAGVFPDEVEIPFEGSSMKVGLSYTLEPNLQDYMDKLLKSYRPDYAAFVAMDALTGKVLTLLSYTRNKSELGNLALKSYFPAASVFKIVTAAAALDTKKVTPETIISFNGGYHTLYRRNVTATDNRWTRRMTLREAFAKSINTVFAKLGLFMLDYSSLKEYAERFQFNHPVDTEIPVQPGTFIIANANEWAMAEAASGFNRVATLSPLQGALMAAAVANDGVMMTPYLIESISSSTNSTFYEAKPAVTAVTMTPDAATELRGMMRETVARGTSRTAFRGFFKKKGFGDLEVGGKTGSLAGTFPKGKCDWFVGYAMAGERVISFAALTVNEENWRIKSSQLSRFFLEKYFKSHSELIAVAPTPRKPTSVPKTP